MVRHLEKQQIYSVISSSGQTCLSMFKFMPNNRVSEWINESTSSQEWVELRSCFCCMCLENPKS